MCQNRKKIGQLKYQNCPEKPWNAQAYKRRKIGQEGSIRVQYYTRMTYESSAKGETYLLSRLVWCR